jgi:glucose-1-phosphate thymidylyltransferase
MRGVGGPRSNGVGGRGVIGLFSAAGFARKLAPAPMSKELSSVGSGSDANRVFHQKRVARHLFERMATAGIERVLLVLRPGKWDISLPILVTAPLLG